MVWTFGNVTRPFLLRLAHHNRPDGGVEPVKRCDWASPVSVWKINQWATVPALSNLGPGLLIKYPVIIIYNNRIYTFQYNGHRFVKWYLKDTYKGSPYEHVRETHVRNDDGSLFCS